MNEIMKNILESIPQQPQRQDSNYEQMRDLIPFANKLGLYDVADMLRRHINWVDPRKVLKAESYD